LHRLHPEHTLFPCTTLFRSGPALLDLVVESCLVTHNTTVGIAAAAAVAAAVSAGIAGAGTAEALAAAVGAARDGARRGHWVAGRSEEHTSELQSREKLVCRL